MTEDNNTISIGNQYDLEWQKVKQNLQLQNNNSRTNEKVSFKEIAQEVEKSQQKSNLPVDTTYAYKTLNCENYLSYAPAIKKKSKPMPILKYGAYMGQKEIQNTEHETVNIPTKEELPIIMKYGANIGRENEIRPLYAVNVEPVPIKEFNKDVSQPVVSPVQVQKSKATVNKTKNDVSVGDYIVPKGMGYEQMLRLALQNQGININAENLDKAKTQFKAANKPGTVHVYNGANSKLKGVEYLWANDKVIIPKFDIE